MLYLHIPYCHHKCTYCAFYSVARGKTIDSYVDAVCREMEQRPGDHPLLTVYIGGGTPSLLSLPQLRRVVDAIRANYDLSRLCEATIEANPENLTPQYLEGLSAMGFFNRLSVGVQSFSDAGLRLLNRVHDSRQASSALRAATDAGFRNISVDLMFGLPNQTLSDWRHNLDRLAECLEGSAVRHLSCYELSVEPGTMLERQIAMGRVRLPDGETVSEQYETLQKWCQQNGFHQYEVSNYCREGFRSLHNSRYWNRTPYIGIGAAAHSFDGKSRRWNDASIDAYIEGASKGMVPHGEETLTERDAFNEYIMTALRTVEGIDKSMVPDKFSEHVAQRSKGFVDAGLLVDGQGWLRPTEKGLLHADGMAAALFVDSL